MPASKQRSLAALVKTISACTICVDRPQGAPLPHAPRPVLRVSKSARLAIAGQAPGTRVHQSGVPFTDPSGDRLRSWMAVTPDEFYDKKKVAIIPMGFCFPGLNDKGGDLPPRKECADAWRAQLFDKLPNLELVLLVGGYAQRWHLGSQAQATLTDTVADWKRYLSAQRGAPRYLPLPHPSWRNNHWLKKNDWFERDVLPVLRGEVRRLLEV